jgi:hypothetical protein
MNHNFRGKYIAAATVAALGLFFCLGANPIRPTPPPQKSPHPETWLIAGQSNVETGEVAFAFSRHMLKNGRPVALLHASRGGTQIKAWLDGGGCREQFVRPYEKYQVDGILWWQGESDALDIDGKSYERYGKDFKRLVEEYRRAFGDVPFIYVTLQKYCSKLKNYEIPQQGYKADEPRNWTLCRELQSEALEIPNVFAVDTSDITFGDLHPKYSYDEIGKRAAKIALKLKYLGQ